MILPSLDMVQKQAQSITDFQGYNHNIVINENQFFDMKNVTTDFYPVLTQRKPRGTIKHIEKPNGLFAKDYLAYVDGDAFYYNDRFVCLVEDSPKTFASMGAYLIMFPDKIMYNTFTDEVEPLEAFFEKTGNVKLSKTNLSYSTNEDTSTSTYIKVEMEGIGRNFKQYDAVEIYGLPQDDLNSDYLSSGTTHKVIEEMDENYIIITGDLLEAKDTTATVKVERTVPEMDFFTENENRLWGCSSKNHEVYCCAIGDATNWNRFEGISTDSYAATIGSSGDFTGAATYLGYVYFFKEDTIHTIMGSKPSNYQIQQSQGRGIEKGSEKSVAIVNETLYYKSRNGVVQFQGTSATSIADPFGTDHHKNAVGGRLKNKYYVSMADDSGKYFLFCYDERKGTWCKEDDTEVLYFAFLDNNLYYIDSEGYLKTIEGEDDEVIRWEAETGDIIISLEKKYLSKINIRADLERGAFLDIFVKYDDEPNWVRLKTINAVKNRSYEIPVRPVRADHMKIKMAGTGRCRVYQMDRYYRMGSVKNVRIK